MKKLLILTLTLVGSAAYAAGDGVPMGTVVSQLANLSLLVGALFFSQRKNIAKAFADKKANFLESVEAASNSKKEAETKLQEVVQRLDNMKSSFEKQIQEAKTNAEESFRVQVSDARNNAEKLKSMAMNTIEFEIQKQVENLRVETFQKSAGMAEKQLETKLTPEQRKAWNTRFSSGQGAH